MKTTRSWVGRGRRDDWRTPPELFARLHREFCFTLDAAASACNALVPRFLSTSDDALEKPWPGVVWCNPPYGQRVIPKWVAKGHAASLEGATVVMLLPATTDSAWFHDYALPFAEVRFIRRRIRFINGDGGGARCKAPFPSCVVIFRPPPVKCSCGERLPTLAAWELHAGESDCSVASVERRP